jgi:hypothetical protein
MDLRPQVPGSDWLIWLESATSRSPRGCWLWEGSSTSTGYGTVRIVTDQSRPWMVHRAAWAAYSGRPIPDGYEVDHLCNTRNCCYPGHLEPVSHEENMRRAVQRRAALRPPPPQRPPSGSIRHRQTRKGVSFNVRYRDYSSGAVVETSRSFDSRKDAEAFLSSLPSRHPYGVR